MRGKNKKEKLEDFFKNMVKSADGVIVSGVKVRLYLTKRYWFENLLLLRGRQIEVSDAQVILE